MCCDNLAKIYKAVNRHQRSTPHVTVAVAGMGCFGELGDLRRIYNKPAELRPLILLCD
jgi:hypothetical protein